MDSARIPPGFPEHRRFEVRRLLGAGGMGVVYEAWDREREQRVALKTLRHPAADTLYRLKREFRALAGISHPNVVALHELFVEDERCFFTMDLVDGTDFLAFVRGGARRAADGGPEAWDEPETGATLETRRLTADPLPPADPVKLRRALGQVARGVRALHQAERLHRDLKPSNVLVTTDGRAVLVDFGIIAEIGRAPGRQLPAADDVLGTPAYMAPEQADGQASEASDWYAVGVMLYEALAGERPFLGTPSAMLFGKLHHDPPRLAARERGAPEDLAALCDALLRRDPAARPAAEEILAVLDPTPEAPARARRAAGPATGELLGRDRELARLREALDETRRGRGSVVHLHGDSGMGKSQLAAAFLDELEERGDVVVLAGRCYQQESVPYKAVDSLIDALSRHLERLPRHEADAVLPRDVALLARLFPVLLRVEAVAGARRRKDPVPELPEVRRRAFLALRELLARMAEARPVVLFIDDLQWGDLDSAPLLDGLMRPPDAPAILVVLAYRSREIEHSRLLRALLRRRDRLGPSANAVDVPLAPLADDVARELAARVLGAPAGLADPRCAAIAREAGGVPFLIHELALAARARDDGSTLSMSELVASRLRELADPRRLLVELTALAGKPIPLRVLTAASGAPESSVITSVRALASACLLRTSAVADGERVECYHDRTREAVVDALDEPTRRQRHARLAAALSAEPSPDLEALVAHHRAAGDDARAAELAGRAAQAAESALAFDRAAELYRVALALGRFDAGETRRLRVRLATALGWAGRGGEAAEAYLAALPGASEAEQLELRRLAANQLLRAGYIDDGLHVLEKVLGQVGLRLPATPTAALTLLVYERARVRLRGLGYRRRDVSRLPPYELALTDVCWSAATDLGLVDTIAGAAFGSRYLRLALELGEPTRVARALGVEAMFTAARGHGAHARAEAVIARGRALASELGDAEVIAWFDAASGLLAYQEGHFRAASTYASECTRRFREECSWLTWEAGGAEMQGLWALFYLGEWRELARRVDAQLEQARLRGNRFDATNLCTGLPAIAWLAADRPTDGRAEIDHAMSQWPARGFHLQHYFELVARAHVELYEGHADAAHRRVLDAWPALERSKLLLLPSVAIEARHLRARAATAAARTAPAGARPALLDDARRMTAAIGKRRASPWAQAVAALLAAGLVDDAARAPGQLDIAATRCLSAEMALFAAAARRRQGELLGGAEGAALVAAADARLREQGVVAPERMAALLAPVLAAPG